MTRIVIALKLNRTRVQMLLGFLLVTSIVLVITGGFVYRALSNLLIENAETYTGETAAQASARLDAVLAQVDSLTLQLVTDARIQNLLYKVKLGVPVTIEQRLSVRPILEHLMAFSWQIESLELYAGDEPFYPLVNEPLSVRIGQETATFANLREGQLVWTGPPPQSDDGHLIAVRQIRLEQDYLAGGGYVVVKVTGNLLNFFNDEFSSIRGATMYLYDQHGKRIASSSSSLLQTGALDTLDPEADYTSPSVIRIGSDDYLRIVRQSAETNWFIVILVPLTTITGGLAALKQALLWSAFIGIFISLILVWVLSNLITKPIIRLRSKMRMPLLALPQPNNEVYFNFEMNDLNMSYNTLVNELHQLVQTVYEKERLKNQAEIKMLQAQIHPHFLFNTLESLYWTLIEKQEEEGAKIVIALSRLFRYTIKTSEGDGWTRLADEIDHCQMYLEIIQYRLGPRLRWDYHVDPSALNARLPKLLIQPLVENAIQHGIEPKVGEGRVKLSISSIHGDGEPYLKVRVEDDGVGMSAETLAQLKKQLASCSGMQAEHPGLGLLNVQRRIKLYYGEKYGIDIESSPQNGTVTELNIPLREMDSR